MEGEKNARGYGRYIALDIHKEYVLAGGQNAALIHGQDLKKGCGEVYLPYALAEKYPNASKEEMWQYLFPAVSLSTDPGSKKTIRHHIDETVL